MINAFKCISIIGLTLVFFACKQPQSQGGASKPDPEVSTVPRDSLILFFGNSLSAGYGVELSQAFPALIQEKLDSLGLGYEVQNSGLSGETTSGGDSRIEFVLGTLKKPLAIFVLELGGNDGLRGISPEQSIVHLQSIVDKVRKAHPSARILLCGMEAPPNMGEDFTSAFRKIFAAIAQKNDLHFLPFLLEKVGGVAELNQPDGIHPTPEGHKILAENVWGVMKEMF